MIEEVHSVVIGSYSDERYYSFHNRMTGVEITSGWFASDTDAITWFQKKWPDAFSRGVEMRRYDE